MSRSKVTPSPAILPFTGKSRWPQLKQFIPVSREKFRQLSVAGLAPKRERIGTRVTFYDNAEVHRWLADPANYRAGKEGQA